MSEFLREAAGRRWVAVLSCLLTCALSHPATADDTPATPPAAQTADSTDTTVLPPVVVSATLLPTPENEVGSSVTVITSQDIEQKQERTLPEVLNDVPGLNVVQTGSPGGTTSVFIRGANANHTKVLVDDIDVSDPSSPDNSFDFSQILASDIARVEVLRGPASGLYGSDAIGGVIDITTKAGSGPPHVYGSLEGGSYNTFNQTVGASGSIGRFSYNLDLTHYHSGDTDVTPPNLVVPGRPLNPDYFDSKSFATKFGVQLTDNFDVGAVIRYVNTFLASTSDDFVGPEAAHSYSDNNELFTRVFAHLVLFDGRFDQMLGAGYTSYHRNFLDPNPGTLAFGDDPSTFNGERTKVDWRGSIKVAPGEVLVLGAEHQTDDASDTTPISVETTNDAGFIELQSTLGEHLFNAASVRYDSNSEFGGHTTFREAPAILISETGTKLKGSVGTGFKAPPLDDLFESFPPTFIANPNLKPETSLGYDAGFEQTLWDKKVSFGSTYFHNDIKNLIEDGTASPGVLTLVNVGEATTYGAENFISYSPWEPLTLRADYTYTMANDEVAHTELLRRPKHKASLNAKWQASDVLSFLATVIYTGSWADIDRSGFVSGLRSTPYTLVNLAVNYEFEPGVTLFARINNLLNQHYQDPIGFEHQGFGIFAGIKVAFDVPTAARP